MAFQFEILLFTIFLFNINNCEPIPPIRHPALMARYVIHKTDWISISTISTQNTIKGYPFVNLKSMSDGPLSNGTGIPYLYMSDLDFTGKDLKVNNKCSIMATLAEQDYCKSKKYDPQDPRCVRILMSGTVVKVMKNTAEHDFAQDALFTRHPEMRDWPNHHNFYVAKVDLEQIGVLDHFGGIQMVSVKDYFNVDVDSRPLSNTIFENVIVIQIDV